MAQTRVLYPRFALSGCVLVLSGRILVLSGRVCRSDNRKVKQPSLDQPSAKLPESQKLSTWSAWSAVVNFTTTSPASMPSIKPVSSSGCRSQRGTAPGAPEQLLQRLEIPLNPAVRGEKQKHDIHGVCRSLKTRRPDVRERCCTSARGVVAQPAVRQAFCAVLQVSGNRVRDLGQLPGPLLDATVLQNQWRFSGSRRFTQNTISTTLQDVQRTRCISCEVVVAEPAVPQTFVRFLALWEPCSGPGCSHQAPCRTLQSCG